MFLLHIKGTQKSGPWPEGNRRNPICGEWFTVLKDQPEGSRQKEVFWYIVFAEWIRL